MKSMAVGTINSTVVCIETCPAHWFLIPKPFIKHKGVAACVGCWFTLVWSGWLWDKGRCVVGIAKVAESGTIVSLRTTGNNLSNLPSLCSHFEKAKITIALISTIASSPARKCCNSCCCIHTNRMVTVTAVSSCSKVCAYKLFYYWCHTGRSNWASWLFWLFLSLNRLGEYVIDTSRILIIVSTVKGVNGLSIWSSSSIAVVKINIVSKLVFIRWDNIFISIWIQ